MKISEAWLREWVNPDVDTQGLAEQLTNAGLEVDRIYPVSGKLTHVVVAHVIEAKPHPNADRLRLCQVDHGQGEPVQVVCGAPNVATGMRVALARPGARLPDGTKIRKSKIRGEASTGMICSAVELGLGEESDGILALDSDAPVGVDFAEYLKLDDQVLEIELTPNRGDCLSIAGVAREVGVINRLPVSAPAINSVSPAHEEEFPIALDAPADCPRYVGRLIRDIDPRRRSPMWLEERLRRSGVRAISPVVDITNYVMLELGHPMHAFDFDKLHGGIRVRRAQAGEPLTLLDGTEHRFDESTLLITDEKAPVALAGIMGGAASSVTHDTQHIFLECAYFDPKTVALTARRWGMFTDAGYRFARGVSPATQAEAVERATLLVLDIVGGRAGPILDAVNPEFMPRTEAIRLRRRRIKRVLGIDVPPKQIEDVLGRLGLEAKARSEDPRGDEQWTVSVPSYRSDIRIEADLIEEVARVLEYRCIPDEAPVSVLKMTPQPESVVAISKLRDVLVQRGYYEAITYSFIEPGLQRSLDPEHEPVALANPLSSEMSVMRTSLWPGLLQSLLHNVNRQRQRVRLFEIGRRFRQVGGELRQEEVVAGIATGPVWPEQWDGGKGQMDYYDLKADIEALLGAALGRYTFTLSSHPGLHPGQNAAVSLASEAQDGAGGVLVGYLGALHPKLLAAHKLSQPAYLFELVLGPLQTGQVPRFQALSKFPAVRRDIAIEVEEATLAQALRDCVGQAGVDVLKNLELFDVYRGEGVDSGKKSIAIRLTFQDPDRTLTDDEVDRHRDTIIASLKQYLGASLRG